MLDLLIPEWQPLALNFQGAWSEEWVFLGHLDNEIVLNVLSLDQGALALELPLRSQTVEDAHLLHVGSDLVAHLVQNQTKGVHILRLSYLNLVVFWLGLQVKQAQDLWRHVGLGAGH